MSDLKTNLESILQEKQSKIIPENIKKDVQIFDITGTYEGNSGVVKLFETEEEMQADESAKEGDLAVVYRSEIQNMTAETETQYISFPETVTLPGAFESSVYIRLRAIDSSAMFDGNIQLSKTSFRFDGYFESGMIRVQYSSSNGITYTRTRFSGNSGDLTNPVDLGTTVKYEPMEPWNDALGYFMQIGGMKFDGLYKYTLNVPINSFKLREQSSANYNLTYTQSNPGLDKIYTGEEVFTGEDVGNKIREILKNEISGAMFLSKDMSILYLVPTGFQTLYVYNNKLEPLVFNSADKAADIVYYKYTLSDIQHGEITMTKSDLGIVANGVVTNLPHDSYSMLAIVNSSDTNIQWKVSNSSYYQSYVVGTGTEIEYDDRYIIADTQFNAQAHELLPGKIAYGKNGVIIGDDSIYDNLDLTLTTKYLLPSVPTDTNLVEDYKITFFDNDFVPTVTNKIQQLIRDITTNTFAQYYSDNNTEYASEPYAHTLSHNNKIYIIAHDQYAGPNLWYYRIDANTGQVEQFKKNVFDNKELDIVGDAPNKIRQTISVNDNTGDIYFLVYENSSQMKLCKADTSGVITYIYSFSVSKIYNADFLGYNEYNNCLYYIFTTDNQITKINKVSMEGQSTNIYSINDTSRLQYITSSTKSFMTVVLPSINKILVINKQTEEIKEISVTEDVYENLAAYEINDDTVNISVGTKDSSYTPLKCYTIKVSTATITPIEAKHQIVPSNSVLWSDDQYLYTDGCVGDKDTGYIINYFDSIYKYDNFIVMAKNKNYNILRITCTSTAMNIEKYYPVKMQDIILGEQGILVKWINADTLVNISDVDLLKLSGEKQSPINLEEYNKALTTTEQILREEVTENE